MHRRSRSYAFKVRLDLRLCESHMMTLQSATKAEPNASQEHIAQTPLSTLSRRRTRICLDQIQQLSSFAGKPLLRAVLAVGLSGSPAGFRSSKLDAQRPVLVWILSILSNVLTCQSCQTGLCKPCRPSRRSFWAENPFRPSLSDSKSQRALRPV